MTLVVLIFKVEFEHNKFLKLDLFVNDLHIADSPTQPTTLLHNDNITSDDVTGSVGGDPRGNTTPNDFKQ